MDDAQTIIARVGATIASTLTVGEVMSAIARQVCEAFDVASADIHRYSAEADMLDYVASWGVADDFSEEGTGVGESYPPETRLSYVPVVRERRIVETHRDDPDLPAAEAAEMDRWGEKSNLDAPLEFGGQVIGVLGVVESSYCRRFTETERQLFSQLAVLAAIAIHNADLFTTLEHLAITDGLTEVFNHRHFYERLAQEVLRAVRYELPLSLLMLDIDDFKLFNDQFGHRAGDVALRELASLLSAETRQNVDLVARYGGEEFAVILPSTGLAGAATVGERLRSTIAETGPAPGEGGQPGSEAFLADGGEGAALGVAERIRSSIAGEVFGPPGSPTSITASVGVASFPAHAASADELVEAADRAVYLAKERGKNRVETALEPPSG